MIIIFVRYDGVVFEGSFTFFALVPGSEYEVMVQARNELGWSESDEAGKFKFRTPR